MTRIRWLPLIVLVTACSDPAGTGGSSLPVAVSWMEWPAAVTAGQPGHIRVIGYRGICGEFRLSAVQSGAATVSVNAEEHFAGEPVLCPSVALIFDTLVPLPVLVTSPAGSAGSFTVDGPAIDPLGGVVRRSFGFVSFSNQQPDATIQAGGSAFVLADSLGCSWAESQVAKFQGSVVSPASGPHVLSIHLVLGTTTRQSSFISGSFVPAIPPKCGQSSALQLRLLEVQSQP